MRRVFCLLLAGLVAGVPVALTAQERDRVRWGGSNTIFPYALLVSRALSTRTGMPFPVGEATGTTAGVILFCAGNGPLHPDISLTSRPLAIREMEMCRRNGVGNWISVRVGLDALVLVANAGASELRLSRTDLWRAVTARIPRDGQAVPNPFHTWREVNPTLPDLPIRVIGPGPESGKMDTLNSTVMQQGCRAAPELADADEELLHAVCGSVRGDNAYVAHTRVNQTYLERMAEEPGPALAILSQQELSDAGSDHKLLPLDGITAGEEGAADGSYALSRSLYLHMKRGGPMEGATLSFAAEFLGDRAGGPGGYLVRAGMMALPERERRAAAAMLADLAAGSGQ